MNDNQNGFPNPYENKGVNEVSENANQTSVNDGFGDITPNVNPNGAVNQNQGDTQGNFDVNNYTMNPSGNQSDSWNSSDANYQNPNMQYANTTAGKVAIGAVTAGFIIKAIICALFPGLGIICAIISTAKQHKFRAKIYWIVTVIAIVLQLIIGIIAGAVISKTADSVDDTYDYYEYSYDDYSYDDESDLDSTEPAQDTTAANDSNTAANGSVTNDAGWRDYVVYLEGQRIELPMKYSDFVEAIGYQFEDPEDATSTLKSNQYTLSCNVVNGLSKSINVQMINLASSQVTYEEAYVGGINSNNYFENDAVFAGNMKVGDTFDYDAMTAALGTPTYVYDSDDSDFHIYRYEEDNLYNQLEIQVSDGKITNLDTQKFE